MRILVITFRDSLEQEIHDLLKHRGITAYTVIPSVHGVGETGPAFGTLISAGRNAMIFLTLPRERGTTDGNGFH